MNKLFNIPQTVSTWKCYIDDNGYKRYEINGKKVSKKTFKKIIK